MISVPVSRVVEEREPLLDAERLGRRAWRWTLDVERWSVGLTHRVRILGEWGYGTAYASVHAMRRFRVGWFSCYYDGEHRVLSLGWLRISWGW